MKRKGERRRLGRAIVVLMRNTTWRCGKLERLIVKHLLHRKTVGFGKSEMPLNEMLQNFKVTGKKKNEFLDALKRLERRNIIRIHNL
ncbi:MAG: hypothetical protein NZ932_06105 [Candidatus Bathyarchaeota archaeon]|nr:hypothetical protein [Candidatus Bathyarchaeota archaeon]MDW8040885.1 hypothetical protein [Nitrososphaerota archaeon]